MWHAASIHRHNPQRQLPTMKTLAIVLLLVAAIAATENGDQCLTSGDLAYWNLSRLCASECRQKACFRQKEQQEIDLGNV